MVEVRGAGGRLAGPAWHCQPVEANLGALETSASCGSSHVDAVVRLAHRGPNGLTLPDGRSFLTRFLPQFQDVLLHVLVTAGVARLVLGRLLDALVVFGVVVIKAVIGFVQEGEAEAALDGIRTMLSPRARVLRDGRRLSLTAEQPVPACVAGFGIAIPPLDVIEESSAGGVHARTRIR